MTAGSGLVGRLPRRLRPVAHEIGKFGVVGLASFAVDVAIFNVLRFGAEIGPLKAKTVSTLIAMTIAYFGNRLWTWRDRRRVGFRREYLMFGLINGGGLAIQDAALGFTFYVLDLRGPLAQNVSGNIVGVLFGTLFRFWAYRKWVFPHEHPTSTMSPNDTTDPLEATTVTP